MVPGYVQALKVFADGEACWKSIAEAFGLTRATAVRVCYGFYDLGLIHVSSWARWDGCPTKRYRARYSLGPGDDCPHPGKPAARRRGSVPLEFLTLCAAIEALQAEEHYARSLAAVVGWSDKSAMQALKALHANGLVYVSGYVVRPSGAHGVPLYSWGPGMKDVRKPKPQPARELWARNNAIRARRRKHVATLRAMAGPIDSRAAPHQFGASNTTTNKGQSNEAKPVA